VTRTSSVLLLSGTVGVGKTTVAGAVGDLLRGLRVPNAVIDLDGLRAAWPTPDGDPFHGALMLRNLRAVAANHRDAGAQRLVLAGVAETRADRDGIETAVGEPVLLCRLRVEPTVLRARLVDRHQHDPEGLRWHLDRAPKLDRILDAAALEDVAVDATTASVVEVARDVLAAAGWASH
jgi:adenylylsulfate kinase